MANRPGHLSVALLVIGQDDAELLEGVGRGVIQDVLVELARHDVLPAEGCPIAAEGTGWPVCGGRRPSLLK